MPELMTRDTPEFTPREAVDRWLDRQRLDKADQTVSGYSGRLKHFVKWSEANGIENMSELTPWDIEQYETYRRGRDVKPITLRNELLTFRQFLNYCSKIGVVDEDIPDSVELPSVSKHDQTNEEYLHEDDAKALLDAYRNGEGERYPRGWAFLELAWYSGARMGAIRGLDLTTINFDELYVQFRHIPEEDTPLKNGLDGERIVGISEDVAKAVRYYIRHDRKDVTDGYGRKPLFTTAHGRIAPNTLRTLCYFATVPCRAIDCPHGNEQHSCKYFAVNDASGCPSSVSPHRIRSGSITWQLNRGLRADVVAKRVNASVDVIQDHYDKASDISEFRHRREEHLNKLGFGQQDNETEEIQ